MNWNKWIRQAHRWFAVWFTITVIADFVSLVGTPPQWIFYLPLPPLFLLMFSGVYMFFLPYVRRTKGAQA